MEKPPFTMSFSKLQIKPLVSAEKDKYLALASLSELASFIPKIDSSKDIDLLAVAFNACVVNRVNRNDDIIDTETALAIYKHFINKPINVEHNRQKVIGVILTAGFSEYGTDKPLTEEEVKNLKGPFNITLGGVVWKRVNEKVADLIEESNDPESEHYLKISASWELGFYEYKILLLEGDKKNIENGQLITEAAEFDKLKSHLRALGGDGRIENKRVCRMPFASDGSIVIPMGVGFTEKPAAEVEGVLVEKDAETEASASQPTRENPIKQNAKHHQLVCDCGSVIEHCDCKDRECKAEKSMVAMQRGCKNCKNQNNFSQSAKSCVDIERVNNMKFKTLQDITDENLKQATAATIGEFVADQLKEKAKEWEAEKTKLDTELKDATAAAKAAAEELAKFKEEFTKIKDALAALEAEKVERAKVEKFNERMTQVTEAYELDDEARKAIVDEIKALDTDEDFAKWQSKAKVLYKGFAKKKEAPAATAATTAAAATTTTTTEQTAQASTTQAVVDTALENADTTKTGVTNTTSATEPKLVEKFSSAFAFNKDNFDVKL